MNAGGAIVIFVLLWWCVFFAVLPMGVKSRWEAPADNIEGADPGAPVNPDLKRKMVITTIASFVLWLIVLAIMLSGIINFKD